MMTTMSSSVVVTFLPCSLDIQFLDAGPMPGNRRYAVDIGKVSVTCLSITLSDSFYECEIPFLDYIDELSASEEFLFLSVLLVFL